MNYKRSDRVAAQILTEVSLIILQGLRNPALGFMTITKVKVSDDLRHAKIFYSVLGDANQLKLTREALDKAMGHIRGELGHRLQLRYVPELVFYYDDTTAYADHINQILHEIHQQDKNLKQTDEEEPASP